MISRPQVSPKSQAQKARRLASAMVYSSILVLIISIASISYSPQASISNEAATSVSALQPNANIAKPSVDQLAVADLAAQTAEVAGLSIASEVSSLSITLNAMSEISQLDEGIISKPQVFEPTSSSAITTYRTVSGDSASSVAARYGITTQTLKWANNMVTDALVPDVDLVIPSVDGVVYTVKEGDKLETIAEKYKADAARITSKNDLELTGLKPGQRIVLPDGVLPANERPGYRAPRVITSSTPVYSRINPAYAAQAGNRYSYGYCTWYAYNRRAQIGRPIGSFWGNASSWAYAARSAGYLVNQTPAVGAIMQNGGGLGHVAVVEEVRGDGSITVSEMNYYGNGGGWARISYRSLDAGAAAAYTFIH